MPDYEAIRDESMLRLQKLKANIQVCKIQKLVEELRSEWKPKIQISEFEIYHGSQKGEVKSITLYWDEYKSVWTSKEAAFRGYVFNAIKEFIK